MTAIADNTPARTGLELMQALVAGPHRGMSALMGIDGGSAGEGWVIFLATPGPQHLNPIGTVHGGFAATLLDSCMACAVHSALPAGVGYSTIDLNISYIKAITPTSGRVTARGEIISRGKRVATARGTLTDSEGRLLATGTTTCLIMGAA